ncbi:hypothetical protein [Sphaerisporangium dianthi]|uniref:Uncharacterized protein n=1 Tax=Sphaerisporangium dianthi TaxID=1436120 RepID=A0ABV9CGV0_9ACTN
MTEDEHLLAALRLAAGADPVPDRVIMDAHAVYALRLPGAVIADLVSAHTAPGGPPPRDTGGAPANGDTLGAPGNGHSGGASGNGHTGSAPGGHTRDGHLRGASGGDGTGDDPADGNARRRLDGAASGGTATPPDRSPFNGTATPPEGSPSNGTATPPDGSSFDSTTPPGGPLSNGRPAAGAGSLFRPGLFSDARPLFPPARPPAGVRSDGHAAEGEPRLLRFAAGGLTIEVEIIVCDSHLDLAGQVRPAPGKGARVEIRTPHISKIRSPTEIGSFAITGLPHGWVSIVCHRLGDPPVATRWQCIRP